MLARDCDKARVYCLKILVAMSVGCTRVAVKMRQTEMAIFEFKRLLEQQESAVEIIACQSLAGLDARQDGRMAGHSMSITSCTPVHSSALQCTD